MATKNRNLSTVPDLAINREGDHRIANNLAQLISILRLQAREVRGDGKTISMEAAGSIVGEAIARIETIARLHHLLARSPAPGELDLGAYLVELCVAASQSMSAEERVHYTFDVADCIVQPSLAIHIGLVCNEIVTNAIKYAHPTGIPVAIELSCRQTGDGHLEISVVDDGIGFPEGLNPNDPANSLGLRLIQTMCREIGAQVQFDHDALGSRVRLLINQGQSE